MLQNEWEYYVLRENKYIIWERENLRALLYIAHMKIEFSVKTGLGAAGHMGSVLHKQSEVVVADKNGPDLDFCTLPLEVLSW